MSQNSRRHFFKLIGLSGLALLAPKVLFAEERRRAAAPAAGGGSGDLALPFVVPGQGMAANLNFQNKNTDVKDAALKVARQGTPFAEQRCGKCMLFTKVGNKDGVEAGKCTLFAGQLVKSTNWCASWSKKA